MADGETEIDFRDISIGVLSSDHSMYQRAECRSCSREWKGSDALNDANKHAKRYQHSVVYTLGVVMDERDRYED